MRQMRKIDGVIEVEQVLDIIDVGTTMPVRCRLENGTNVVVKYMKNPFGQRVLINELVGSCIADEIGLVIPEFGICNMSEGVIKTTNSNDEIDERNAGIAFFTKDYSSSAPPSRQILSHVKNKQTEKLILFDHLVNNCDRHIGNLILNLGKEATLYVIDNSHIITEGVYEDIEQELEPSMIFSKRVLQKNQDVYDILATSIGYSEQKILEEAEKIKETMTEKKLNSFKKIIPSAWVESVGEYKVDLMFQVLNRRAESIIELSKMIVEERRK